ncbi:cytochrome c oxidase assembly protein [Candidatus Solirubrobacter pratensis]|uniref:cytochrome c oxidase assembly protein n=1 Tax=Candidatus Solirubrobacter pratensis TaxID=1298857 RepID=UPI00042A2D54|nr:cytochrome c oxidase assembly protein [Candidatus Solirubrobacter pratensis]
MIAAVCLAIYAGLYAAGARRVPRWPAERTAAFAAGLALVAVALLSPLDGDAERRLSAHMAQHLLLGLVAPLLLAAGAPVRLALAALHGRERRALARLLHALPLRPAVGWAAFTAVMLGTHLTGLYELAVRDPLLHALEHLAYLAAGLLFWAPLVGAGPLPHPPGPAARLAWLLAAMPPMGLVGAHLLTGGVAYASYPSLADQRTAAGLMWGAGSLVLAAALVWIVFAALLREEERQRRRETVA